MIKRVFVSDEEIEWIKKQRKAGERKAYQNRFDGSYEASRGDYEGAILTRDEYNSGRIS